MNNKVTITFEAISCILAILSSLYLSIMTNNANMLIVFSCFFVSFSVVVFFYFFFIFW